MSKRATQAELVARRQEIQQLILKGVNSQDIVENMVKKWETSKRAISEDIRAIHKEWQETAPAQTQANRNKYKDRLEMLFNKSLESGMLKTALDVQKEINKLDGLYAEKEKDEDNTPEFVKVTRRNLSVVGEDEKH
jgi:site-specific DNA-adenine methylase